MLRLISYASVDSFIKREYVLDIINKYEIHPKVFELYQSDYFKRDETTTTTISTMNKIRSIRREYYNDFEDCIRDCKNANKQLKTVQKQIKIHHSDGDNGDSDSDYVDCCESNDANNFKIQSSSKSMPQVNYTATNDYIDSCSKLGQHQHHQQQQQQQQQLVIDDLVKKSSSRRASRKEHEPGNVKDSKSTSQQPTEKSKNKNKDSLTSDNENSLQQRKMSESLDGKSILSVCQDISKTNNEVANIKSTSNQISNIATGLEMQSSGVIVSKMSPVTKIVDLSVTNATTTTTSSTTTTVMVQIEGEQMLSTSTKRRSCKKAKQAKLAIATNKMEETPAENQQQNKMTVASNESGKKINKIDDASWGSEREVTLERVENNSFGISIVGGKVNVSGDSVVSGIFIKNIIVGSSADKCGLLKVGDRILAVDGVDIRNSSHEIAVKTIKNASDKMKLLVQSLNASKSEDNPTNLMIKFPPPPVTPSTTPLPEIIQEGSEKDDVVKDDIKQIQDIKRDPKKSLTVNGVMTPDSNGIDDDRKSSLGTTPVPDTESEGSDDDDDEEDKRDLEGKTYTKAGNEIDRASAGNVKRSKEEIEADPEQEDQFGYTTNKIKKRYGNLGTILCQTIDRGHSSSIGISLAGHRDRNKMACFIAGINPKGIASSSGGLEIGDEILEVNGVVLHGRCHLNASAIIKGLPGPILQLIILRRKLAVEELAVKPVTQFPVEISNEDAFASFKNIRHVTIKKGNQSLGIMIIEGKHAEVGQGIFVSDIQEGSNAEKAGLNIGDMILAVNKDSLLGCNYDTAANMLKKTEGIVTLTVCNPNKKDADGKDIASMKEIDSKDPSRPVTPKPQPSPAKEVPHDPLTCEIIPNQNTSIELKLENQPIGIQVAGGSDTLVNTGAVIVNIIPGSIAEKDKRLKVYDQIIEINNTKMTPELTHELIQRAIKQVQSKVKMTVYRSDPLETESIEIELNKKGGKNLGIGFFTTNPHGLFITDIVSGGIADLDGRIQKSDIVTHVNSESISNKSLEECSTLLKTVQGKVSLKILRAKPKKRAS